VLIFHNTSIRAGIPFLIQPGRETVNDVITRNNLFIGTRGPAIRSTGRMTRCDFDNDAFFYGINGSFARWNGATYASPRRARNAQVIYWERGPIMLMGMRGFENAPLPLSGDIVAQPRKDNRPLLNERSRALDKAIALPNFNDTFVGEAPDLGCCELGQPLPHVGPRTDWRG
jgi:hypothetical protein